MIEFAAKYFDGKTSKKHLCTIVFDGQNLSITVAESENTITWPLTKCRFTPVLGTTDRTILFPDGAKCMTTAQSAIEELEKINGNNTVLRLVHTLEQRWRLTLGCLVGLIISVYLFTAYGIPVLAQTISNNIPIAIMNTLSDDVLVLLDRQIFEPTKLETEKQDTLKAVVHKLAVDINSGHEYRLKFRNSIKTGANAFALPSGTIIVTDLMRPMLV